MSAHSRVFLIALVVGLFTVGCTSFAAQLPTSTIIPSPSPEPTPTQESPGKILFIGNSVTYYNDGVDWHLEQLMKSASPPKNMETASATLSSAPLEQLWEYPPARDMIANEGYDLVVLQEDLQRTNSWKESRTADSFYEYARKFNAEIEAAGGKTMLFMAWPVDNALNPPTHEEVSQIHREIAEELGVDIAPVDLAFQISMEQHPELDMYYRDGIHPSIFGTYLAAAVMYAAIFEESPVGLPYLPPKGYYGLSSGGRVDGITAGQAAILQQIAWQAVQEFQAKNNR